MHTIEDRSESSTSSNGDKTETEARKVHCEDGECKEQAKSDAPNGGGKSQGFLESNSGHKSGVEAAMEKDSESIRAEADQAAAQMQSGMQSMHDSMERNMRAMEQGMHQEFDKMMKPIHNLRFEMPKLMDPMDAPESSNTESEPLASSESSSSASQSMHEVWDGKNRQFKAVKRTTRCKGTDCITEEVEVTPQSTDHK